MLAEHRRGAGDLHPLGDKAGPAAGAAAGSWGRSGVGGAGTFFRLIADQAREAFRAEAVEGGVVLAQYAGPTIQALAGVTEVTCKVTSSDSSSKSFL